MTEFAGAIHYALSLAAPIEGVSIGRRDDVATWRIDAAPGANAEALAAQLEIITRPGGFVLIDAKGVVHVIVRGGQVLGELAANLSLVSLPPRAPALTPRRWYVKGAALVEIRPGDDAPAGGTV